jgi:hypothetical protein
MKPQIFDVLFSTERVMIQSCPEMVWALFWAIFSQTLVTLVTAERFEKMSIRTQNAAFHL